MTNLACYLNCFDLPTLPASSRDPPPPQLLLFMLSDLISVISVTGAYPREEPWHSTLPSPLCQAHGRAGSLQSRATLKHTVHTGCWYAGFCDCLGPDRSQVNPRTDKVSALLLSNSSKVSYLSQLNQLLFSRVAHPEHCILSFSDTTYENKSSL